MPIKQCLMRSAENALFVTLRRSSSLRAFSMLIIAMQLVACAGCCVVVAITC